MKSTRFKVKLFWVDAVKAHAYVAPIQRFPSVLTSASAHIGAEKRWRGANRIISIVRRTEQTDAGALHTFEHRKIGVAP
jgi:hypothetical protein